MLDKSLIEDITIGKLMEIGVEIQKENKGWNAIGKKRNPKLVWVEQFKEVKEFLNSGYDDDHTTVNYRSVMASFIPYTHRRPKEILDLANPEIKGLIKSYCAEKRQTAPAEAWLAFQCLNSFFDYHERKLTWRRNERVKRIVVKAKHTPSSDEVWRIAESSMAFSCPRNPRNKAAILFAFMTGMRRNAVSKARAGLLKGYSESDCPIQIDIWCDDFLDKMGTNRVWVVDEKLDKDKFGGPYTHTFLDKHGFLAVQEYQQWHKSKFGPIEEKDFLFSKLGSQPHRYEEVRGWGLGEMFKTGLRTTGIPPEMCSFHSLRRSFKKVCVNGGVDYEAREAMMCHRPPGSGGFYWDHHDVELPRREYLKCDWTARGTHQMAVFEKRLQEVTERNEMLERRIRQFSSGRKQESTDDRLERLERVMGFAQSYGRMQQQQTKDNNEVIG